MKEYEWNEDTLSYFEFASCYTTMNEVYNMIKEFVKVDCQLEEGETEKDLVEDLMNKIYKK